jgi:hypothetical protein
VQIKKEHAGIQLGKSCNNPAYMWEICLSCTRASKVAFGVRTGKRKGMMRTRRFLRNKHVSRTRVCIRKNNKYTVNPNNNKKAANHSRAAEVVVARRNVGLLFAQHLDIDAQRLFAKLDGLVELALVSVPV